MVGAKATIETELAMSIVILQLPEVKYSREERPAKCAYCPGETFQRWGGAAKRVSDPRLGEVWVYRYRCCQCKRTFRHYPSGVSRAKQTERMKALVAIGWVLGLSYRGLAVLYRAFGAGIERMSAWRDVQARAEQLRRERHWRQARVVGLDGAYVRCGGKTEPVMVAVDLGTGQPMTLGFLDEKDPRALKAWLEPWVQRLGISVIVSDDLNSYKQVADELGLEHQVCQFHLRRWVGRALRDIEAQISAEWRAITDEVRAIVAELPAEGDKRLLGLWRQLPARKMGDYTPLDQLRSLIGRLVENWSRFRVFDWQPDVPWTNNPTEQAIGRMKMRARTVRGYKNLPGMYSGLMASGIGI